MNPPTNVEEWVVWRMNEDIEQVLARDLILIDEVAQSIRNNAPKAVPAPQALRRLDRLPADTIYSQAFRRHASRRPEPSASRHGWK
jgi:hypothetical protein